MEGRRLDPVATAVVSKAADSTALATERAPTVTTDSGPENYSGARRINLNVPKFKGDQNVTTYLQQFEVIAKLARWPAAEWGLQLLAALEGRAINMLAVETLSAVPTYEEVAAKLRLNFGQEVSAAVHMHELALVKRGDQEALTHLCFRVKEMAVKAMPELDVAARSRMCMQFFIKALDNEEQERSVWAARTTTVEEALEVAVACENGIRMQTSGCSRGEKRATRVRQMKDEANEKADGGLVTVLQSLADQLEHVANTNEAAVRQLRAGNQQVLQPDVRRQAPKEAGGAREKATTSQLGLRRCFNCGEEGHISRSCPRRQKNGKCFNCGEDGHFMRDCVKPKQSRSGQVEKQQSDFGKGQGATGQAPDHGRV